MQNHEKFRPGILRDEFWRIYFSVFQRNVQVWRAAAVSKTARSDTWNAAGRPRAPPGIWCIDEKRAALRRQVSTHSCGGVVGREVCVLRSVGSMSASDFYTLDALSAFSVFGVSIEYTVKINVLFVHGDLDRVNWFCYVRVSRAFQFSVAASLERRFVPAFVGRSRHPYLSRCSELFKLETDTARSRI